MNFFGGQGYLTNIERKIKLSHRCNHLDFTSCVDLSIGVTVTCFYSERVSIETYTKDVASFIGWWVLNVLPDLNGFSGLDTISFNIEGFDIVKPE